VKKIYGTDSLAFTADMKTAFWKCACSAVIGQDVTTIKSAGVKIRTVRKSAFNPWLHHLTVLLSETDNLLAECPLILNIWSSRSKNLCV
jgi:hypothetical protein